MDSYQKFLFFDCVSCCLGQKDELGKLIQGTFEFMAHQKQILCEVKHFFLRGENPTGPVPRCPPRTPCIPLKFDPFDDNVHWLELGQELARIIQHETDINGAICIMLAPGVTAQRFCKEVNKFFFCLENIQICNLAYLRAQDIVPRGKFLIFKLFYININSFSK